MRVLSGILVAAACQTALGFSAAPPRYPARIVIAPPLSARKWGPPGTRVPCAGPGACARAGREVGVRMVATAASKKSRLLKAIQKPRGTIAIMAEIKRKDPGTPGLEFPIPSVQELSQCLNAAKVQSIAVWTDEQQYGTTMDDMGTVAAAQQKFKGNFPGPAPVLMLSREASADVVDAAAAAGAAGVLLPATLDAASLCAAISSCFVKGMEPVVLCRDREGVQKALESGAQVVALDSKHLCSRSKFYLLYWLYSLCSLTQVVALDSKTLGVDEAIALADSGEEAQVLMALGGIKSLDDAWRLRDAGFGCVVVGEELLAATYGRPGEVRQGGGVDGLNAAVCRGDTIRQNDLNTFILALSAKASVKFGPTGVGSFRERGAKSYRYRIIDDPG